MSERPETVVKRSAAEWQEESDSCFEHRVVRYLMKRYGLGEVGSAEVPEDRSQRLTLASFGRQQPKFPISLEAHALGGWQFDDLTADNVLIFPHKTLLMQVYRVRHASWRNQHSGLFGVVFRMPSIAAEAQHRGA